MHSPHVENTHPATMPLRLYRGDSYAWVVRAWSDPEHTIPVDLAGATPRATIRGSAGSIELACTLTEPNVIDVELASDAWGAVGKSARWDLQLAWTDGRVFTLLAGSVSIAGDVTQ